MKLDVDDMFSETGELNAVGLLSQTDVVLYFGKIPADKVISPQLTDRVVQPFVGCIGDVTFNQKYGLIWQFFSFAFIKGDLKLFL